MDWWEAEGAYGGNEIGLMSNRCHKATVGS